MHHYSQGQPTNQAHKGIPDGHFEEEQGLKGFYGPVSHLIRKKPSTRWVEIEGELKPRMFDVMGLEPNEGLQRLMFNAQLTTYRMLLSPVDETELKGFRNADGDTVYFCHSGSGQVLTDYGLLSFKKGQYLVIPKCLTHTLIAKEKSQFFVIENRNSHYEEPDRGIVGRHAVYDIHNLGKPDLEAQQALQEKKSLDVRRVDVKHSDQMTHFKYDADIYDVIGWKGDLFPFTLHMDNMMPLMSHRAHLPPSAHSTFVARDFVICTFLPRPLEEDDDALKVPFYHQNIDYDEVIFYHDGDFFSRDNLKPGMMSYHPMGFPHGPHPKAMDAVKEKERTDEYAVMVDSRWPLKMDPILQSVEWKEYWKSWQK